MTIEGRSAAKSGQGERPRERAPACVTWARQSTTVTILQRRAVTQSRCRNAPSRNPRVDIDHVSTEELLQAWRDASRAAELAERLAAAAVRSAERADRDTATAMAVAALAESAAESAERAACEARAAANGMLQGAAVLRAEVDEGDVTSTDARSAVDVARARYREGETEARNRYGEDGPGIAVDRPAAGESADSQLPADAGGLS